MVILPQHWAEKYLPLPDGWLHTNAPGLLRRLPEFKEYLRFAALEVGVAEHLLVTRCQLEQSAITYAWDGSTKDYGGGLSGDLTKLAYLCGADKTDSGPRPNGWFGPQRQLLACALRFKYWYRGKDGPRPEWKNWLSLQAEPITPITLNGVKIIPENQISADCLRYTPSLQAQIKLKEIATSWFPSEYGLKSDVDKWAEPAVNKVIAEGLMTRDDNGKFRGNDPLSRQELAVVLARLLERKD